MLIPIIITYLMLIISPMVQFQQNSSLNFTCKPQGIIFRFKHMSSFTIYLENKQSIQVVAYVNNQTYCTIKYTNNLCTFVDFVRQINFTCSVQSDVRLQVQKSDMLMHDERVYNEKFVSIDFGQESRGLVTINLQGPLFYEIQKLPKNTDYTKQFFRYTDCAQNIALFQDKFLIAVKKSNHQCTLGLINFSQDWIFRQSKNNIVSNKDYEDYLDANKFEEYRFNVQQNITLQLLVQNDNERELDELELEIRFINKDKIEQVYKIKNFQKGLTNFKSKIYHGKSAQVMQIHSNINIFYTFLIVNVSQKIIKIQQDQYFFTHLQTNNHKSIQILLELNQFDTQKTHPKNVTIKSHLNQLLQYSFAECNDTECTKLSSFQIFQNQFIPLCQYLQFNRCSIKMKISSEKNSQIAIIPYVSFQRKQVQINKLHKGVLQHQQLAFFYVPQQLLKNAKQQITVQVTGARMFLTYIPDCRKIYCCRYQDINGQESIPNQNNDLFIILKGTRKTHYTFSINTLDNNKFTLHDGVILKSQIKEYQNQKYYTFPIINKQKKIQISCTGAHDSLILLINVISKQFPTFQKHEIISRECYSIIEKDLIFNKSLLITIIRAKKNETASLPFNILGVSEGTPIFLPENIQFYDLYQIKSNKTFEYIMLATNYQSNDIAFKVDIIERMANTKQKQSGLVQIAIGTKQYPKQYKFFTYNTLTVDFNSQMMNKICKAQPKQCNIFINVQNLGNTELDLSVLIWMKLQAVLLVDGYYINFQTGVLLDQSHFYIQVKDVEKPIDIYIYSTQIQIQTITKLWDPALTKNSSLPFPSFKLINKQLLDKISYSFSSSVHYSPSQLKRQLGPKGGMVLITLRDIPLDNFNFNQQREVKSNQFIKGQLKLVYTTGSIQMNQDDQFQYILQKNQKIKIKVNINKYIQMEISPQIYLHISNLLGKSSVDIFLQNSNQIKKQGTYDNPEFLIINITDLKTKGQVANQTGLIYLIFQMTCRSDSGRYLIALITTNSDYRQLTLGIPQQFYLKPNSSIIFEFINYYNQFFKIKLNRKQGFPEYKIRSCSPNEDQFKCIKELKNKRGVEDPANLIESGRSHQLVINNTSEHFCKDCRYYIAFYSYNAAISGSITITRSGLGTLLVQAKPFTTEVYQKQFDVYRFKPPKNKTCQIIGISHMGAILFQVQHPPSTTSINRSTSSNRSSIIIELEASQNPQQVTIFVSSNDGNSALYTILLKTGFKNIQILDGLPMKYQAKNNSRTSFSYLCQLDSRLIIMSNISINAIISCSPDGNNKLLSTPLTLKKNLISNKIIYSMKKDICSKYNIDIQNQNQADFTILINGQDIILLPFNIVVPAIISKSKSQVYQLPIQQKTYLKIIVKVCQSGNGLIGIAQNKSSVFTKDYKSQIDIINDKFEYTFEYTAKPGILYIIISSKIKTIQYSIQVFPFNSRKQIENQLVHLQDPYISTRFIKKHTENQSQYQITFQKLVIQINNQTYHVNYLIIQSNRRNIIKKYVRCHGQAMLLPSQPNQIIRQYRIDPIQEKSNSSHIVCRLKTSLNLSYFSIIPISQPRLPPYITYQSYQIIQLYNGENSQLIERFLEKILQYLEKLTKIEDQKTLYQILFILILIFNLQIVLISCCLCSKYCRRSIEIERKPVPLSEHYTANITSNSLDMIQKQEHQLDLSRRQT